ncbi:MAG: flagellar filament capping protein FliD [Lachnospiraceae bacterium]|nr:flagellar filament capping protein FliD [Lachnospiraceae bacterium]
MASAIMDNMYSYYLSTYGKSTVSRYDSHKKSELRSVYNSILKSNKESPLYKIKESGDVHRFAIDIKENARHLKNVIASLSVGDNLMDSFQKKSAVSDQPDIADAVYIGEGEDDGYADSFQLQVLQLASAQQNQGRFLKESSLDFEPGSFSFDLNTNSSSYEFQFNVNPEDTNRVVMEKLTRLFNSAHVGIRAEIMENDSGECALFLTSNHTGLSGNKTYLFQVMPNATPESLTAMDKLGIHRITSPASNAIFLLNGKERSAYSNTFTVNNVFEVRLNGVSTSDTPATLGFKTNADAVADNIQELVDSYNSMIGIANQYKNTQPESRRLLQDIGRVAKQFRQEFEPIGLDIQEDSTISVNREQLREAADSEHAEENFKVLDKFKHALSAKANEASIDPMKYVNKVLVAYKNPGKNFTSPYISSMYSGMMLDKRL